MRNLTKDDVLAAADRLRGHAVRTKLIQSDAVDAMAGTRVWFKPECNQHVGAFKYRGARNRLSAMTQAERARGVVAFSSGNHAQGVARAARELGIRAVIVMPHDAPEVKLAGVRRDGADIIGYDRMTESREAIAAEIADREGRILVPSYDDPWIIAGQGTVGLEMAADLPDMDALVTCIGGGGLCAGISLALPNHVAIYGAEPVGYDDHKQSLAAGRRVRVEDPPETICDAIMTPIPGKLTWAINGPRLAGVFAVSDDEALRAMAVAKRKLGVDLEPGGAVALAALLRGEMAAHACVGCVLSGGNVDAAMMARAMNM